MPRNEGLYKPAAPDALLRVGGGKTLYVGSLERVDWHLHGAPVFIAGIAGDFRGTFGVMPSYVFGKIARAGTMPQARLALRA